MTGYFRWIIVMAACLLAGCGSGPAGTVTIDPGSVTLAPHQQQVFTVTVMQCGDTHVVWEVSEGSAGGSITSDGVYTAPDTPGEYHVMAACDTDGRINDTATINVR